MDKTYTFRMCRKSDLSQMSELGRQVFGVERDCAYWEWKYFRSPAGKALSPVAIADDRIVGLLGSIPVRFSITGKQVLGGQELDLAILEQYRRFNALFELTALQKKIFLKEGIDFVIGFTLDVSSDLGQTLFQRKKITPIPRLQKVLDLAPLLAKRSPIPVLPGLLSPIANRTLRALSSETMKIPEGMQVGRIDRFDERFDIFWNRIKHDYPIMTVRDAAYLNWRYMDAPQMDYEAFCLERPGSGQILGYMVLGSYKIDYRRGQIYDIVTSKGDGMDGVFALLRHGLDHFRRKGAATVECWMLPHCHVYPALRRLGFLRREQEGRNVILETIRGDAPTPLEGLLIDRKNWFLSKGDSDID